MEFKEFYWRKLPHIQPLGGMFFVTFNLKGAIPKWKLKQLKEEREVKYLQILKRSQNKKRDLETLSRKMFIKYDKYLDSYSNSKMYLKNEEAAKTVADSLHFWDKKKIELLCYCIMANHVHVLMRLFDNSETETPKALNQVMHSIKLYSAKKCNEFLGLEGNFWEEESYDRLIRNRKELRSIMRYILNNPVKAGLCKEMTDWKWSYIKEEYNDIF
ncbi:transposase [Shivajiella indica]|uniref:Transposase n=1 Tax=Shivajiella indica TaxID=872115 RepID=A0ABW5BAQ4_9BACT